MLINVSDVWDEAISEHSSYVSDLIASSKNKIKSEYLLHLLERKEKQIIAGRPAELEQLIHFTNGLINLCTVEEGEQFYKECENLFNYKEFSKKREKEYKKWNAYKLCQKSKYILCPYCQQNFAFTVLGEGQGSFRPTLDHFFPKSIYPYLSLSLYNLVPSCYVCNSSLKGSKNFFYLRHLNPLCDKESLNFELNILEYINRRASKDFELQLDINFEGDSSLINSVKCFLLNERYTVNFPQLRIYVENLDNWLLRDFSQFKDILGEQSVFEERHALNFYLGDYKNELLGKIKKDLYYQMEKLKINDLGPKYSR